MQDKTKLDNQVCKVLASGVRPPGRQHLGVSTKQHAIKSNIFF